MRPLLAGLALGLAAGCAPSQAFYRPVDGRAVGRDGYVGTVDRVPPGAVDREAQAVVALSPLLRQRVRVDGEKKDLWKVGAVIEFRNKRKETITFLPESLQLDSPEFGRRRPDSLVRTGSLQTLRSPVEIGYWRRASFHASWRLPCGAGAPSGPLVLRWSYRCGGKEWPQETAFGATDSRLAEQSLAGDPVGMVTDVNYRSESGVPFLMDVPFVGAFFRSGSTVRSRSTTSFDTEIGAGGTWWPLEGVLQSPDPAPKRVP